jgi:hypothetical protein
VQAKVDGLLQRPQSALEIQVLEPILLQSPVAGQSPLDTHAFPVLLHVPPWIGQSEMFVQTFCVTLHLPAFAQSDACMQLVAVRLQTPG